MSTIEELLAQGQAYAQAGQSRQAEASYRQLIAIEPRHAQAHHDLGIVLAQQGKLDEAAASMEQAQVLEPERADLAAHLRLVRAVHSNNQGVALAEQGRLDEAAACHARALELKPDYAEAHYELGYVRLIQNRLAAATDSFERALGLNPSIAEAHNHLGVALVRQGSIDEALVHHRRAVELKPEYADAHYNLAVVLARREHWQEAADAYRRTIALRPDHAAAHNNLAVVLAKQDRLDAAVAGYKQAIRLKPDYVEAHTNLGAALVRQNKVDEAVAAHRRAVELKSDYAEAHYNLGIALVMQDRLDDAERSYRRALELRPDYTEAWYNLAYVLLEQNELERSGAACARALELKPDYADAHFSLAVVLLLAGRFAEGWRYYEWRLKQRHNQHPDFSQPRWNGEPLDGRTILLVCEQGLGDTLQFIRYASLVQKRGGRVVVECAPQIASLLATCAAVDRVVALGDPLPHFDVYAMLASLPAILETSLETIPAEVPYLWPDEELVGHFREKLGDEPGLRVGIAWQGNPDNLKDRNRSIPLSHFAPLARIPGVRLYSLQLNADREQLAAVAADWPIVDLGESLPGFLNSAAILRNLDLVITCDSAPAHLAGALGIPVWVALPFVPDWRWMLDRSDSPWYPTMRLFRQTTRGDWKGVFQAIEHELAQLVAARVESPRRRESDATSAAPVQPTYQPATVLAADHTDRGIELAAAGKLNEAETCFRQAIDSQDVDPQAHGHLGNLLLKQGKLDEAARSYQRLLELRPDSAEALYSLGLVAREQARFEESAAWCQRAVAIDDGFADAHYTLAVALLQQNKLELAADSFRRAVQLNPDFVGAHLGLAFAALASGRLAEGWSAYEWRLKNQPSKEQFQFKPRWAGEPLEGKTILVCCEQGFGDSLQFIRYASRLKQQGATVFVQCRMPLIRLLATMPGIDGVIDVPERLPAFDFHVPLLSLPAMFTESLQNVPVDVPYFHPDSELVAKWQAELGGKRGLRIGIAWQGDPTQPMDRFRSIPLAHFEGIVRIAGASVYSLQPSPGREQLANFSDWPITDLGDQLGDFHDTGAIVSNLDLVITCDSAPAHLAGALGVPVWVALPFAADWRWMLDRNDSPWYPTMHLFRQTRLGEWQPVFDTIERELAKLVKRTSNAHQPTFLD